MIVRADLERHINAALSRHPDAKIIAFSDARPIELIDALEVGARHCRLVHATSELGLRLALHEGAPDVLILVTPLTEQQIGLDVKARLYKQSLLEINVVETIKTLLRATSADDRLRRHRALCQALLSYSARVTFTPVAAGALTIEEAWRKLLVEAFDAPHELLDLAAWLEWSILAPTKLRALLTEEALGQELVSYMREELGPERGPVFAQMWALWSKHQTHQAPGLALMQLGLTGRALCEALADKGATASVKEQAMLTLGGLLKALSLGMSTEQRQGFELLSIASGRAYARVSQRDPQAKAMIIKALDAYLRENNAEVLFSYSRASSLGWQHRIKDISQAIAARDLPRIEHALEVLKQHDMAASRQTLIAQLMDVQRLVYKLQTPSWQMPQVADVATLAAEYIAWGSIEDMIREGLIAADLEDGRLQQAVREVLDDAATQRREDNARFARALAAAIEDQSTVPNTLGVHEVLQRVAVPVVQSVGKALLIVLDGMSWAVLRSLLQDTIFKRWVLWSPQRGGKDSAQPLPLLAALPSVTTLSRTSLLSGELKRGGQREECEGFEHNLRLKKHLGARHHRRLFHKADVDQAGVGGVGPEVQAAILDPKADLVGVVLNSVDDQLSGAQQLAMSWSINSIPSLRTLLGLAEQSERAVILTSDHGHVLDDRTQLIDAQATSPRYRPKSDRLEAGEVFIRAASVRAYTGQDELVLLHDEQRRYTGRHRGYHGGASMPEVITPLLILTDERHTLDEEQFMQFSASLTGWYLQQLRYQEIAVPEHISTRSSQNSAPGKEADQADEAPKSAPRSPSSQLDLLGSALPPLQNKEPDRHTMSPSITSVPPTQDDAALAWIEGLFASSVYQQQLERFSTIKLAADDTYKVLVTLAQGQGAAHLGQLSQVLRRADTRVSRYIIALSSVLNIEGYTILSFNRQEQLVKLDKALLIKQFNLK